MFYVYRLFADWAILLKTLFEEELFTNMIFTTQFAIQLSKPYNLKRFKIYSSNFPIFKSFNKKVFQNIVFDDS